MKRPLQGGDIKLLHQNVFEMAQAEADVIAWEMGVRFEFAEPAVDLLSAPTDLTLRRLIATSADELGFCRMSFFLLLYVWRVVDCTRE